MYIAGNEDSSRNIRLSVAAELFQHAGYYCCHPNIETVLKHKDCVLSKQVYGNICLSGDDREYDFKRQILKEAMLTCEDGQWISVNYLKSIAYSGVMFAQ